MMQNLQRFADEFVGFLSSPYGALALIGLVGVMFMIVRSGPRGAA